MIRKEDFAVIQALHQRGVYQKDIAAELNVHPKTVSRALRRYLLKDMRLPHPKQVHSNNAHRWAAQISQRFLNESSSSN